MLAIAEEEGIGQDGTAAWLAAEAIAIDLGLVFILRVQAFEESAIQIGHRLEALQHLLVRHREPTCGLVIAEEGVDAIVAILVLKAARRTGKDALLLILVQRGEEEILKDGIVVVALGRRGGVQALQYLAIQRLGIEERIGHERGVLGPDEPNEHQARDEANQMAVQQRLLLLLQFILLFLVRLRRLFRLQLPRVGIGDLHLRRGRPQIPRKKRFVELLGERLDGEAGQQALTLGVDLAGPAKARDFRGKELAEGAVLFGGVQQEGLTAEVLRLPLARGRDEREARQIRGRRGAEEKEVTRLLQARIGLAARPLRDHPLGTLELRLALRPTPQRLHLNEIDLHLPGKRILLLFLEPRGAHLFHVPHAMLSEKPIVIHAKLPRLRLLREAIAQIGQPLLRGIKGKFTDEIVRPTLQHICIKPTHCHVLSYYLNSIANPRPHCHKKQKNTPRTRQVCQVAHRIQRGFAGDP